MLRTLVKVAATAWLVKKAWDQFHAEKPSQAGTEPLATPDDLDSSAAVARQPTVPDSPLQYH